MLKEHPLEKILEIYLDNLDLKLATINDYEYSIIRYINFLKTHDIRYPQRKDLIKYKKDMSIEKLSIHTMRKQIIVIKNFYRWLRRSYREYNLDPRYQYDISDGIRHIAVPKNFRKDALTLEDAQRLTTLAKEKATSMIGLRNYCIVLLMITTGLRLIEISRARKGEMRRERGRDVLYIHGKGRHVTDELVPLPEPVKYMINQYLYLRNDINPFLFISKHNLNHKDQLSPDGIRNALSKLLIGSGLKRKSVSVHSLRHTCAVINLETGGSLEETRQLLRHCQIETTLIYAQKIASVKNRSPERISKNLLMGIKEEALNYIFK